MTIDLFAQQLEVWVSQYLAIFCLASIGAWAGGLYAWAKHWEGPVRDAGMYMLTIGSLTLILALLPDHHDVIFWTPVVWFCFTMLLMFELLWLSFLADLLYRTVRDLPTRSLQQKLAEGQQQRMRNNASTPYRR